MRTQYLPVQTSVGYDLIGQCDLGGAGDGMHVNVVDGYAYVGHMGSSHAGTSVVDVRDPTNPRLVHQIPRPPGTHSHKVQVVGDVMLVNHERNRFEAVPPDRWSAGVAVYDISRPDRPTQVGFYETPGTGTHRMTYWSPPYAYVSGTDAGFAGRFLQIVDLTDPSRPIEVGRWWYPGQHTDGGEEPTWEPRMQDAGSTRPREVALHHAIPYGHDRVYGGWWDAGIVCLDTTDPTRPELLATLDLGPGSANTHTVQRLPGRDILIVTDEQLTRWIGTPRDVRIVDVSDESAPRVVGTFPTPEPSMLDSGLRWGPHNLHEMRPGSFVDPDIVHLTYFAGGLRVYNTADPAAVVEIGHVVPTPPPGLQTAQINDVTVGAGGLVYMTERVHGGLYIAAPS